MLPSLNGSADATLLGVMGDRKTGRRQKKEDHSAVPALGSVSEAIPAFAAPSRPGLPWALLATIRSPSEALKN